MKKAICIGINNYPGTANDLKGCVNDANDWAGLLEGFGFETRKILDAEATKSSILSAFGTLVTEASAGDVVVVTYSGHGTQVLDQSGDEADSYDEALYVYDGSIVDDDLRAVLEQTNRDAQVIFISDSCFSGTVTRALISESSKPRFVKTDEIPPAAVLKKRFLAKVTEEEMVEVLLTGCSDSEYSYDAYINGRWNGAMTANAVSIMNPDLTYSEFYSRLRKVLPSDSYPQTPQLEGSTTNKNRKVFSPKTDSGDEEPGNGDGDEDSGSSGCLSALITLVAVLSVLMLLVVLS